VPLEIIPPGTHFDFIGRRYLAFAVSGLLIAISLAAVPLRGIRMGIDFAGGTEVQLRFQPEAHADEGKIRTVVAECGVADPTVVRYGETKAAEFLIRFRQGAAESGPEAGGDSCPLTPAQREQLTKVSQATGSGGKPGETGGVIDRLLMALGNAVGPPEILNVEFVGPRVGDELRRDGLLSVSIACLMILIYIALRFSARYAPGAIIALVHDVVITSGVFVVFGLEFDLRVLAAILAILGYSLNDTIIVYDRIRENMSLHTKHDLVEVLNRSVNDTLSRTLLTSLTTLAAVMALLLVGGDVIRPFALAMAVGIFVGTYSSIFIASPTLLFLERRRAAAPEGARPPARRGEAAEARPAETRGGERRPKSPKGKGSRAARKRRA
jgi:preprotein translocase subunit SecF